VKILANENFPRAAVDALRSAGDEVLCAPDEEVIARAERESRLLVTFDKDFGDVVYRRGLPAGCGVVLFRFAVPSPETTAQRTVDLLQSRTDWAGQFAVVEETRIRLRPLPPPAARSP